MADLTKFAEELENLTRGGSCEGFKDSGCGSKGADEVGYTITHD